VRKVRILAVFFGGHIRHMLVRLLGRRTTD
jgi:hypothetical protein